MNLQSRLRLLLLSEPYANESSGQSSLGFEKFPNEILSEGIFPNLGLLELTRASLTCKFLQASVHPFMRAKYYPGDTFSVEDAYEDFMANPCDLFKTKISSEIDGLKDGSDDGLLEYLKEALFAEGPINQAPYYDKKRLNLIKLLLKHKTFSSSMTFAGEFLTQNVKEILPHLEQPIKYDCIKEYVVFAKRIDQEILEFVLRDYPSRELSCSADINELSLKAYKNPITVALLLRLADDDNYERVVSILEISQVTNSVGGFLLQFINRRFNKNLVLGIFKTLKIPRGFVQFLLLLCARAGYAKEAHLLLRGEDVVARHLELIPTGKIDSDGHAEFDRILETAIIYGEDEDQLFNFVEEFGMTVTPHHLALASYCRKSVSFLSRVIQNFPNFIYNIKNDLVMTTQICPGLIMRRYQKLNIPIEVLSQISQLGQTNVRRLCKILEWRNFLSDKRMQELLMYEYMNGAKITNTEIHVDADFQNLPRTITCLIKIHLECSINLAITKLNPIKRENARLLSLNVLRSLGLEETELFRALNKGSNDNSNVILITLTK